MVVVAADADRVPLLRHGLGHRGRDAALHGVCMKLREEAASTCAASTPSRMYLFYTFIIDFTLEMLDLIHRIYEADESFRSLDFMVHTRLLCPRSSCRSCLGHPGAAGPAGGHPALSASPRPRARACTSTAGCLTLIGIFAMRWNVVIGGQLFSKSFLGLHHLQDGLRHARRPAAGDRADAAARSSSSSCW